MSATGEPDQHSRRAMVLDPIPTAEISRAANDNTGPWPLLSFPGGWNIAEEDVPQMSGSASVPVLPESSAAKTIAFLSLKDRVLILTYVSCVILVTTSWFYFLGTTLIGVFDYWLGW